MWSLLRTDANTVRVVVARLVSRLGGTAGFFIGIWGKAAYDLQATPFELALLMAVSGLGGIVGSAGAGVLVDRTDPRRVVIIGELLFVPSILALILADSMVSMTLLLVPASVTGVVVFTAVTAFPPYLSRDPQRLERINAAVEAAGTIGFILGPVAGGLLVRYADVNWVFVLDAATSLVAVVVLSRVAVQRREVEERRRGTTELVEGLRFVWQRPSLRLLLALGAIVYLSFGMFGALEPLFFRDVLRRGPEVLGYVNAVFGVGLFLGALASERLPARWTGLTGVTLITAVNGLGAVLYTGTGDLRFVVLGAMAWSLVLGALFPLHRTLAHLETPDRMVGRVMGTFAILNQAGDLVPLTFAPLLAAALGVQLPLVLSGIVVSACAVGMVPVARRLERRRAPVPAAPGAPLAALGEAEPALLDR